MTVANSKRLQRPGRSSVLKLTTHLVFFLTLSLAACSTSLKKTREFNRPYGVIRSSVQKLIPRGIKTTSRNGRTYESNFFIPKGNWDDDGTNAKERAFARTTILGSSRPYTVEVAVYRQQKIRGSEYSEPALDEALSERLANDIEDAIANRREDRNMIDDFKPF